ncbi:MAG: MFS transporter [Gammaproteobacteria bacterium]|nr:MFS transporter [Gammaproteobacteria bacterium]
MKPLKDVSVLAEALSPLRHPPYAVLWTATVVTNIGWWMYTAAAAWLMTDLSINPLMVSLVQALSSLPMFLLALPAGALADIVDKRRLLIWAECGISIIAATLAVLVWHDRITPVTLLIFTFLLGAGAAIVTPPLQSIVPLLIRSKDELPAAVALNSVGMNISRAIGPALVGVLTVGVGIAAPFWVNAIANIGSIGGLLWWRPPKKPSSRLPAERFVAAIRTGVRYARNHLPLRATLFRSIGFFLFASAYWALLPLVARTQIGGGPTLYGLLLSAIGGGAIVGAMILPRLRAMFSSNALVAGAAVGTAFALVIFGVAREPWTALIASLLAGSCWITAVSSLNVSAQFTLPDWVRGRGLAIYVTIFSGALAIGSALWGGLASIIGLSMTHFVAAACTLLAIPLTRRWKLQGSRAMDLAPSMHWPVPVVAGQIDDDAGPVLVTIEYTVHPNQREPFLAALYRLSAQRRRDGAYAWGVFEDAAERGRFIETYLVESWLEHLRLHERVTRADHAVEECVHGFLITAPKITHLVTPT